LTNTTKSHFYNPDEDKDWDGHIPSRSLDAMPATRSISVPGNDKEPTPPSKSSVRLDDKSFLVLVAMFAAGVGTLSCILSIALLISFKGMKESVMSPYVVDNAGNRLAVSQIKDEKQKIEHIQKYANFVAQSLYTYRWYIPEDNGTKRQDKGISIDNGKKVPTGVFVGSYVLEPRLRAQYLPIIADQLARSGLSMGAGVSSTFVGQKTSVPIKTGDGQWMIRVSGIQRTVSSTGQEKRISVIREFVAKEAPVMSLAYAETLYKDKTDNVFRDAEIDARSWGLVTLQARDISRSLPSSPDSKEASNGNK
jgi:hypothetical protein